MSELCLGVVQRETQGETYASSPLNDDGRDCTHCMPAVLHNKVMTLC